MQQMDEGFFKSAYEKYKLAVIKCLTRLGVNTVEINHTMEEWIRDYFLDKMDAFDCARAIRDNNVNESTHICEEVNDMDDEVFHALKTAQRAGYKVEFPNKEEAPAAAPAKRSMVSDNAARIAELKARMGLAPAPKAAPAQAPAQPRERTTAADLEKLAAAARTAERAGFTVRKMTDVDIAKQVAEENGLTVRKKSETPAAPADDTPAPAEKKSPYDRYFAGAARFLNKED